jgi:hypothetical protein
MKKLFVFAVAFIAFTGFTFSGKNEAQPVKYAASANHEFIHFRIHKQGKSNVVLNWGVTTPAGVSNFIIERSYDGDFYDAVAETPCNNNVRFTWKDESVFPGVIYYRINCIMNDGRSHYSNIETIRIVQR